MKKLFVLPFLLFSVIGFSQPRFIVQNQTTRIFNDINDAVTNANSGDTLYIPGGGFALANSTISKTLHFVGVGHYPDSTLATLQSRIVNSSLTFNGSCDSSSFEGIYFSGSLVFGSNGDDAMDISIKKCRVLGNLSLRAYKTDSLNINFHITESVLATVYANNGSNCLIEKSIIFGTIISLINSTVDHCILSYRNENFIASCNSCLFKNSIIAYAQGMSGCSSCEFSYNLFPGALPFDPANSTFSGSDNIVGVGGAYDYIFNSINGYVYNFSYDNDYHLKTTSTGTNDDGATVTILGKADDGTNMGIYGSAIPYKEGAVPFYPHIQTVDIDKKAANGELGVKITVAGQER